MTANPQRVLAAIVAVLIGVDLAWGWLGHFHVDVVAYGQAALLSLALWVGGIFYQTRRPDPKLAAMILGASFLALFSAAANLLNYYLLTVAGPRIDAQLDAVDRAMGFDWYRMMLAMAIIRRRREVVLHIQHRAAGNRAACGAAGMDGKTR